MKRLPTQNAAANHGRLPGRYRLWCASVAVITVLGIILALLLNGVVITEVVFAINGLGRLLVGSILGRDYPMVQGVILLTAVLFIFANFIVDILYALVNPRIRYTD